MLPIKLNINSKPNQLESGVHPNVQLVGQLTWRKTKIDRGNVAFHHSGFVITVVCESQLEATYLVI